MCGSAIPRVMSKHPGPQSPPETSHYDWPGVNCTQKKAWRPFDGDLESLYLPSGVPGRISRRKNHARAPVGTAMLPTVPLLVFGVCVRDAFAVPSGAGRCWLAVVVWRTLPSARAQSNTGHVDSGFRVGVRARNFPFDISSPLELNLYPQFQARSRTKYLLSVVRCWCCCCTRVRKRKRHARPTRVL